MHPLIVKLATRRCRNDSCKIAATFPGHYHLTWFGRWRYIGTPWKPRRSAG